MATTIRLDQVQLTHHDLSQAIRQTNPPPSADLPADWELADFDVLSDSLSYSPSFEELLDTYLRNFTGRNIPKSKPVHAVNVHVILSPQQLDEGAHLPLRVPTFGICPYCGGSGTAGFYTCDQCHGQGFAEQIRTTDVLIPRHTAQSQIIPISLHESGVDNLYLNIHLSLQP